MRVHYLQHVPFEGLGSIHAWLESRAATVTATRLYEGAHFPAPASIDLLIVMGGPMSVNDEASHEWLVAEKRFINEVMAANKGVMGICLGAQLIANCLGAKVFGNAERELGWFPIEAVASAAPSPFAPLFASPREVFHWHGETFDLPAGATHLARSAACEHQAFSIGDRVLGMQFHLEMTAETLSAIIQNCPDDLAPGRWVQSEQGILGAAERFESSNRVMAAVLSQFESLLG